MATSANAATFNTLLEDNLFRASYNRYRFYKNYALDGISRGEKIYRILEKYVSLSNKKVLDLGCGYGGTSIYFARQGCSILAADIDYAHIRACSVWAKENGVGLLTEVTSAENLAIVDKSFDGIIMNDVIEHLDSIEMVAKECGRILKDGGFVLLTVPNRLSILNIISDPHFGYFGIILLPIKIANFYIRHICKKSYGYEIKHYPTSKFILNTFFSQGMFLKKINLSVKFYDPSLIASPFTKKMTYLLKRNPIIKAINKIGLFSPFLVFFNRFISRGFMLIGEKYEF